MADFAFIFTISFMLLGPLKVIPAFSALTQGADLRFKRAVAIRASLIASAIVVFVALAGVGLLAKYRISIDGVQIAGGLVLLIAALKIMFVKSQTAEGKKADVSALQLALSPVASPVIVPPAGVAAILIFMMLEYRLPGTRLSLYVCLASVMLLDFLVMFFIDRIMKLPGLMLVLRVLGEVLVFMQVGLAVQTVLFALIHMEVIKG